MRGIAQKQHPHGVYIQFLVSTHFLNAKSRYLGTETGADALMSHGPAYFLCSAVHIEETGLSVESNL